MNGSITFGAIAPFDPNAPTGANMGLSIAGGNAQLGQTLGDPANPADMTADRSIPLNSSDLEQAFLLFGATNVRAVQLVNFFRSMFVGIFEDHSSPIPAVELRMRNGLNPNFAGIISMFDQAIFPAMQIGYESDISTSFPVSKTLMLMGFSNLKNPAIRVTPATSIAPDPQWSNLDIFFDPPAATNHDLFLSDLASDGQFLTAYIIGNTGGTVTIQAQGADQIATPTGLAATITGTADGTFPSITLLKYNDPIIGAVWFIKSMHGTWA